ncbi:ARM repeat-containing protein [Auriscalpium vulgare]|uniref:ARM repeat-containing protein n=1 Tax=Auriscalpium vulgare TaxID=40419 RepID=A0ACB8RU62_9AGAM|nr:ARM repeat-containing protein [Auriscalpium vulgare]
MEAAERLVRTWVASPRDKEVEDTASGIASGEIKLLHVVKALGEYLISEEGDLRNKGVDFLAAVLSKCPPQFFNRQSTKVLLGFFTSKLDDTETVIPALRGLLALTAVPSLIEADAVEICTSVFAHVKMQALVQAQRFIVFSIFDSLIAKQRDALRNMGDTFLSAYIALVDGEKDPRNLMVAFAIARVVAIEFDISRKVEDLFNITFCYFPITFRPPPDDPYGITADDLRNALRSCLDASPLFGSPAIPLFIDKLNAGSPVTKRDTLQTLAICLPVYGPGIARTMARKLWSSLKLEIFQPTDAVTEEEALKTTQVLIKTIYADDSTPDAEIEGLAKDACEECILILKEPEKSQAKPAIKVLSAFMSTTPSISRYTLSHAIPHLIKLFLNPDELPNRGAVLTLLFSLIAAARDSTLKAASSTSSASPEEAPFLLPYKDEVLGALITGLKTPSSTLAAIEGLSALVTTPGLLEDEEVGFVVQNVNDVISGPREDASGVIDAALDLLTAISATAPTHVSESTLPLLFSALPDRAPAREDAAAREKYRAALSSLTRLCSQAVLFETLVVRLLTRLSLLCSSGASSDDPEPAAAYAHALLTTLANVLVKKAERGDVDVPKYIERLVPRLFNLLFFSALVDREGLFVATGRIVTVAARLVNLVIQTLPEARQKVFVDTLVAAYLKGEVGQLAAGDLKLPMDDRIAPFEPGATESQGNLVAMFSQAIVALRKEITISVGDQVEFLRKLLYWSVHEAKNALQRESAWHIIAAVVNKRAQDLDSLLFPQLAEFWQSEIQPPNSADSRRLAIGAWTWVSKALLVRSHPQALPTIDRLFELFDDDDVNWDAARAVGLIGATDKILTKKNHVVIKILYAQRYANSVLPKLVEGAQSRVDPRRQTAYLVALTSLIKSIPKSAYEHEMPTLMPLLLRGLDLPDTEIRANVIDTLLAAAQSDVSAGPKDIKDGSIVAEHATSLTAVMLKNSSVATMADMKVRIAALRYLAVLPRVVRYDVLHPQRSVVLKTLSIILDDPKRVVRKEAVDARTNWYTYNG